MAEGTRPPRAHQRVDWRAPIQIVRAGETTAAETRNASVGGLLIATPALFPFGTRLTVVFRLPGQRVDTTTEVVVRWSEPGAIGVQFVALRAVDVRALNQLLR